MNEVFAKDITEGLSSRPKYISSKYFYDKKGSALFSEIMQLPEYYLTNSEFEILKSQSINIITDLALNNKNVTEIIELGAGDGLKTIEFLKALEQRKVSYKYIPIDISEKALDQVQNTVNQQLTNVSIYPKHGDYFQILNDLKKSKNPKVILFLGSNIGNMEDKQANWFLKALSENLNKGDKMILGVDLKKEKRIVFPAYNDEKGVTSEFNLNLLERINNEFNADFNRSNFKHTPEYDEEVGVAKSSIQSLIDQEVRIKSLDLKVVFEKGEKIHTEISRKYNDAILNVICENTGWNIQGKFIDSRKYFANYILEKL